MKIVIASDHGGFKAKKVIFKHLNESGYSVKDIGCHTEDSVDYPDFAHPVAQAVEEGKAACGVLICGSGNGVAITANKHAGVRAAICWGEELASLARQHNDANVLCLPVRFISLEEAKACLQVFLDTPFEGGRHQGRVNKISCC